MISCGVEPYIAGPYRKHNNNFGYVSDDERNTPQGTTHPDLIIQFESRILTRSLLSQQHSVISPMRPQGRHYFFATFKA